MRTTEEDIYGCRKEGREAVFCTQTKKRKKKLLGKKEIIISSDKLSLIPQRNISLPPAYYRSFIVSGDTHICGDVKDNNTSSVIDFSHVA